jgi:hypothetical protein
MTTKILRSVYADMFANTGELSNNIIQKGLAFGCDWSGTVANSERVRTLRDPAPPAGWPWWGFGGAARCRFNRTEDLNVKVCEKATSCIIDNAGPCVKVLATTHCRPQG